MITREGYARSIGYGAMCCESFVAVMALIAACTLEPGVYFSMNVKGDPVATVAKVSSLGFPVTTDQMGALASQLGEKTLFGRTGGAATLAVGMAKIFSRVVNGRGLDLWYHFAIMFEALFILTTLDAGTRVGRYLIQNVLGGAWKPLGDPRSAVAAPVGAVLMVAAWGHFLVQGVRDPLGGINSLWPLFGIANQMLAAIALCLATTVLLKMSLQRDGAPGSSPAFLSARSGSGPDPIGTGTGALRRSSAIALVTLVPLVWLVAVTFTAGVQKIWHADPRIGFLAQARVQAASREAARAALDASDGVAHEKAARELATAERLYANQIIDAVTAGLFLVLVALIVIFSAREWILLMLRRKPAVLFETDPVWLPEYAVKESGVSPGTAAGAAALALALAKEWSGEAHLERARPVAQPACACQAANDGQNYVAATEARFTGVRRCC